MKVLILVYNIIMYNLEEGYLESFINLKGLLSQKVNQESKSDFLTFVRLMAPSLVSGFKMGKHIEVISNKLKQLEEGEIKRLMVFLPLVLPNQLYVLSYFLHGI